MIDKLKMLQDIIHRNIADVRNKLSDMAVQISTYLEPIIQMKDLRDDKTRVFLLGTGRVMIEKTVDRVNIVLLDTSVVDADVGLMIEQINEATKKVEQTVTEYYRVYNRMVALVCSYLQNVNEHLVAALHMMTLVHRYINLVNALSSTDTACDINDSSNVVRFETLLKEITGRDLTTIERKKYDINNYMDDDLQNVYQSISKG
jgi:ATP-dependent Lon protease